MASIPSMLIKNLIEKSFVHYVENQTLIL